MTCNFVTKKHGDYDYVRGVMLPSDHHPFPALIQNLGDHKFKDNHNVETAVTRWPIILQNWGVYHHGTEKLVPRKNEN
jgi:hypothetical protein